MISRRRRPTRTRYVIEDSDSSDSNESNHTIINLSQSYGDYIIDEDMNDSDDNTSDDESRARFEAQINFAQQLSANEMNGTPTKSEKPALSQILSQTQSPNSDNCCTICMEVWTNSSEHRLVALNCGHLFGKSCIERWIQSEGIRSRCPQCNTTAKKKDIRIIFARNLRPLDTTEKDRALADLENERQLRMKIEKLHNEDKIKLQVREKEIERLKKELMDSQLRIQQLTSSARYTEKVISDKTNKCQPFLLLQDIEISGCGGCRLLSYSNLLNVMTVTLPINTGIWKSTPGFGVQKIDVNLLKATEIIHLHSKTIKDLEFNQYDGTILSASLDKTVKLSSVLTKGYATTHELEVEAWSVAFNSKNKSEFYAGLRNGDILLFDTRMTSNPVDHIKSVTKSPVVSLHHIDYESKSGKISGILATQLDTFSFHERINNNHILTNSDFRLLNIPCEGRFSSSHFEANSGHALLSCRPSTKHKNITHYVMDLTICSDKSEHSLNSKIVQYFEGGTEQIQMPRSRIFAHPFDENSVLVCAGDESAKGALIWDVSSSSCIQKLHSDIPILDLSLLHHSNTNNFFLTALNEKYLKVYKCIS